ncbi:MAG: uracil-DNA glycosylase [Actinomycetia bacterium]|nr:uracil-DNA glycosylase [Actinomycetes bacterium]
MELQELKSKVEKCAKCSLSKTRVNLVFGTGSENAEILFVGEAPGYYEDIKGEPFVGKAGKLLDKLLNSIGMSRKDVYIANVLKCRPPNNRNPLPEEIEECRPYLKQQIKIIKPKVVCTLGNFATRLILGEKLGITSLRGKKFEGDGYFIFPTFHPAAVLRNPGMGVDFKKDLETMKKLVEEGEKITEKDVQLELF